MPLINDYRCNTCGFVLPSGWGGHTYVTDDCGNIIVCPHPSEMSTILEVLGDDASDDLIRQRTGFNSDCLCMDCLWQFYLDLQRDSHICPRCKSGNIRSLKELINQRCPKCKQGTIREIPTGIVT